MTNKIQQGDKARRAIGLKYNAETQNNREGSEAPRVVSKGVGDLAEAIIAAAEEAGIIVHEDPYLTEFWPN